MTTYSHTTKSFTINELHGNDLKARKLRTEVESRGKAIFHLRITASK